jgi:inositol-phosphate transport system permease protein
MGDTAPVNYSRVAAVGMFQMIPVLIFFIFTQEYLLSIFGGGSKGGT